MKAIVFVSCFFSLNLWAMPKDSAQSVIIKPELPPLSLKMNQPLSFQAKKTSDAFLWSAVNILLPGIAGGYILNKLDTYETAGSVAMGYGLLIGPSMGNFYAKDYSRGSLGIGIRALGTLILYSGLKDAFSENLPTGRGRMLAGTVVYLTGLLYSVYSTLQSVNDYNSKHNLSYGVSYDPKSKVVAVHTQFTV